MQRSIGVLPSSSTSPVGYAVAAVDGKGIAGWNISGQGGPQAAGWCRLPSTVHPSGALRLQVYPDYAYYPAGSAEETTTNLLLMAGGGAGLLVYELVPNGTTVTPTLKTVVPMPNLPGSNPPAPIAVYDVALDVRRHVAYLACYNAGVAMVDMANPYAGSDRANPYAILDADGNLRDDRILGFLHTAPGSRSTLVVDSDTGLVYVGEQGTDAGLKVVGAQQPRMEFLLDDSAHPGQLQAPGFLSAFDGDRPKLALWLPGGAGTWEGGATRQTIHAGLDLYDRSGLLETPANDAQGNPVLAPVSTVYRPSVTLTRQSSRKTDASYNFYLQRNDNAADKVTLGMLYDPQSPDPSLMVSRQGGSLKGTVALRFLRGAGNWGANISVAKAVSRPWVEWVSDQLIWPETCSVQNESQSVSEGTGSTGVEKTLLPPGFSGPVYLAKDLPRKMQIHYQDSGVLALPGSASDYYPGKVSLTASDPNTLVVTPSSIDVQSRNMPQMGFQLTGKNLTPANGPNPKLRITFVGKDGRARLIHEMEVVVASVEMGVDYTRDGTISFGNDDTPTHEKPYEFWVNDDHEVSKPDSIPPNTRIEDDDQSGCDWQDEVIATARDLEDFTRLYLKTLAPGRPVFYQLHWECPDGQAPSINLFKAVSDDPSQGGLAYINDPIQAQHQALEKRFKVIPDRGTTFIGFEGRDANQPRIMPFIFEGAGAGTAGLVLTAKVDGVVISQKAVRIRIQPIINFYERWSVLNPGFPNPPKALPSSPEGFAYTPQSAPDEPYLIFVHGFNISDRDKEKYAQTAYKRLWWSGYKGRFGVYDWPCSLSPLDFDLSEYNAWLSGQGLKSLLVREHNYHPNAGVYLFAHSQGNVVAGEALREAGQDSSIPSGFVKAYIASQAAISASYYQADVPRYKDRIAKRGTYVNDDLLGHYPHGFSNEPPYLEPAKRMAAQWVNLYNRSDWAMGDDVTTGQVEGSWWAGTLSVSFPNLMQSIYSMEGELNERRESVFELDNDLLRHGSTSPGGYQWVPAEHQFRLNECMDIPIGNGEYKTTCEPTGAPLDLNDPHDRFKLFSQLAQFWGIPLGSTDSVQGLRAYP